MTSVDSAAHLQQCANARRVKVLRYFVLDVHDVLASFVGSDEWAQDRCVVPEQVKRRLQHVLRTHITHIDKSSSQPSVLSSTEQPPPPIYQSQWPAQCGRLQQLRVQLQTAQAELAKLPPPDTNSTQHQLLFTEANLDRLLCACAGVRSQLAAVCAGVQTECDALHNTVQHMPQPALPTAYTDVAPADDGRTALLQQANRDSQAHRLLRQDIKQRNEQLTQQMRAVEQTNGRLAAELSGCEAELRRQQAHMNTLEAAAAKHKQQLELYEQQRVVLQGRVQQAAQRSPATTTRTSCPTTTYTESASHSAASSENATALMKDPWATPVNSRLAYEHKQEQQEADWDGDDAVRTAILVPNCAATSTPDEYGVVERCDLRRNVSDCTNEIAQLVTSNARLLAAQPWKLKAFERLMKRFEKEIRVLVFTVASDMADMVSTPEDESTDSAEDDGHVVTAAEQKQQQP